MKQRGYHAFTDIPSTDSLYYNAVSTCYIFGWMDGVSEDTFGVQEPLTKAEMITLLARLYNLRNGGDGSIPAIPESLGDYIRFYDEDHELVCDALSARCPDFYARPHELTVIFWSEELSQETLTIEIGFPGDRITYRAPGVRITEDTEETEGRTKYLFTFPEDVDVPSLNLDYFHKDAIAWRGNWKLNQQEPLDDPTPYDAILYLLYREPANLPYCFRTMSLEGRPNEPVWRMELAIPLAALCQELPETREIDSLPDLPDWRFGQEETKAVLSLYRRGILEGFDEAGTFAGSDWLTRGQAALVTDRALALMRA